MASKPRTLIVAPNGISARETFTRELMQPLALASTVRHIFDGTSLRVAARSGEPAHNTLWAGPEAKSFTLEKRYQMRTVAKELGIEVKDFRLHPDFADWYKRINRDPEFDFAHRPIFIAGDHRMVRSVTRLDWRMPSQFENRIRIVNRTCEQLHGINGEGRTVWICPQVRNERGWYDLIWELAYTRGFAVKDFTEHPMYLDPRTDNTL